MERYVIPAKEAKEIAAEGRIKALNNIMTEINIGIGERAKQGYDSYQIEIPILLVKEIREILEELGYETEILNFDKTLVRISWE